MESNAFSTSHLPSQALVVLSEAASGLHEALRGQRPFPTRLPDAKDLHNMSLVGSYGTHLLHSFHPHLLQSLNHGMLANGGPASYFANERGGGGLGKPSMLGNFQFPSAFSPPKYIGISLDQNLFNGNESFRTDSASPTCTSHESMEGSNDYDTEKGESSPRSNNSDPRDLRHVHNKATTSSAPTTTSVAAAVAASTSSSTLTATHLAHHHSHAHHHHQQQQQQQQQQHHHHHHHHPNGNLLAANMGNLSMPPNSCPGLRGVTSGNGGVGMGILSGHAGHAPDICPVCGIKLTPEEWNSHFLTELDRLYKMSSAGSMERTSLQATYMFAPPCPAQENAIRTSHNRWETFQRIRNNRQNRLRIKVRKRKYGNELYFMENLFCNSCPICKRKYAMETGKIPGEEDGKMQEEIETVDVESCNDEIPDSGSEMQTTPTHMTVISGNSNMHNNNNQPGKLDGILYRTACVINKENALTSGEDDVTTNVNTASSSSGDNQASTTSVSTQGHISVKNVSELSSTTHHYYNDSVGGNCNGKDMTMETCHNDSDEDVIVDDDDSMKLTNLCKKRKFEEVVGSSRTSESHSPPQERPRSEPQVTSTEPNMEVTNNNNNNNNYSVFEESLRSKSQQPEPDNSTHTNALVPGLTQLDSKVGISSENKPDDENKCFICKTGIKDFSTDAFFRGRNLYFHQSCANVMSSYRLSKDLQQQQQNLLQQQQQHQLQQKQMPDRQKSPQNATANAN